MKFVAVVCVVVFALLGVAFGLKDPICGLPPAAKGFFWCNNEITRYSYHAATDSCDAFVYRGSGGNLNNFETFQDCEAKCKEYYFTNVFPIVQAPIHIPKQIPIPIPIHIPNQIQNQFPIQIPIHIPNQIQNQIPIQIPIHIPNQIQNQIPIQIPIQYPTPQWEVRINT